MTDAERSASERRVSRAVNAIGKLNLGEWREAIAIMDARWLSDDEPESKAMFDSTLFTATARGRHRCERR